MQLPASGIRDLRTALDGTGGHPGAHPFDAFVTQHLP